MSAITSVVAETRHSPPAAKIDAIAPSREGRVALPLAVLAVVALAAAEVLNVAGIVGPWRGPVGVTLGIVAVLATISAAGAAVRDRSAVRDVLDELRASEQQAAGITSIAVDSIITIDEQQRIIVFNHGAEFTFGWTAADVLGRPLSILLPERLRDVHARHIERFGGSKDVARRMGQRQQIVGLRRDGTEFPAEASISRLDLPRGTLYTVLLRDITERHRQQQDERFLLDAGATLSASLDYEATLLSGVHIAVPHLADCCVLDLLNEDGTTRRIASVHDDPDRTKALRLLEHRQEIASDWPFPVASVLADGVTMSVDGVAETPSSGRVDSHLEAVQRIGITSVTSLPLVARGRLIGVLTLITTDPDRLLDGERARVAESVSKLIALAIDNAGLYQTAQRATVARDEVLGAVSHDLRNPLAAITLCARALRDETSDQRRVEIIDTIAESTGMMNRMIQDLLDVATIDSGHLRIDTSPHQVEPLLEQVLEMTKGAANEKSVAVHADLASTLPDVLVDPTRFVQVLANLVSNAVKFTEPGGRVSVAAEPRSDSVAVSVSDTGIGIPADHLPHIFDRHWHARRTARTAGTGLGLAIARGIVEAHGGHLTVDSTEGVGSTFSFTVPLAPDRAPDLTLHS
jgi:PAS domain S-box-containing protein